MEVTISCLTRMLH